MPKYIKYTKVHCGCILLKNILPTPKRFATACFEMRLKNATDRLKLQATVLACYEDSTYFITLHRALTIDTDSMVAPANPAGLLGIALGRADSLERDRLASTRQSTKEQAYGCRYTQGCGEASCPNARVTISGTLDMKIPPRHDLAKQIRRQRQAFTGITCYENKVRMCL